MRLDLWDVPVVARYTKGLTRQAGRQAHRSTPRPGPDERPRRKTVNSGLCIQVTGGSTANGATLNQASCNTGTNEQWLVVCCLGRVCGAADRHRRHVVSPPSCQHKPISAAGRSPGTGRTPTGRHTPRRRNR
ncbi:RICIN domain-containing protein [Streptomyces sp. SID12488]|uniref:RICIN domain-containing protein n=1 Tax=Streptomyces sp. SID12488 TaxID=2706040 RepID=UPI001EF3CA46|nr:RICIN domain-containing protein [Streptomyces sp. SID12488]